MIRRMLVVVLTTLLVQSWGIQADGAIVSSYGDVQVLSSSPPSVEIDALESNDVAWVFTERVGLWLTGHFKLNIVEPGYYNGPVVKSTHDLFLNQFVDTHFVTFDPVGRPTRSDPAQFAIGSITFDQNVLAIVTHDRQLWDTESLGFGAPGTLYPRNNFDWARGVDASDAFDFVELSSDRRTVSFSFAARTPADQFRVITASAVPEPTSLALWSGLGIMGLIAARRRRRTA